MAFRAPAGHRFALGRPGSPVHLIEAGHGASGRSLCGVWPGWSPQTASATWPLLADELPEGGRPCADCGAALRRRRRPGHAPVTQRRLV
jgi:hypothetical protein